MTKLTHIMAISSLVMAMVSLVLAIRRLVVVYHE